MSVRKVLFWIHLAIGCLAGIVILIMSLTGVLLTYERQINAWVDRGFRSSPPAATAQRLPMEQMLAEVSERNHGTPSSVTLRSDRTAPAEVGFGREHMFLVDVYTGHVLAESSPGTRAFFSQIENVHRWLAVPNESRATGRAVTGACNAGFLLLVVSGPFLWLPRKWTWNNVKAVALFRGGLSGRARDFNWHNVIGIWSAAPLFLIVLSGVIMSYPWANNLLYRVTGNEPPVQGGGPGGGGPGQAGQRGPRAENGGRQRNGGRREHRRSEEGGANASHVDEMWARAEKQVPGWRSLTLRTTPSGRGPMTFSIDTGNGGRPDQRSQLVLDPRSGSVIRYEPFSSYNAGRRLRGWFRFIHTGEAGGLAGQSIAGLASAGAVVLVWTGIWLSCRRLIRWRKRTRVVTEPREAAVVSG